MNQSLRALPSIDPSLHESVLRDSLAALSRIDFTKSPPEMARIIFDVIENHTGGVDLYAEIKRRSNSYILAMLDELHELVNESENPFETGLRLAVAGNIIDFGAKHDFSDELIHDEINRAMKIAIPDSEIRDLEDAIAQAENILYIGDNAGEIIFDRIFIEQLPCEKIIFAVRGSAIINDALMSDAETAGITEMVKVISSGVSVPGTVYDLSSEEFKLAFDKADIIISKGQGNYETLNETDKNIFFLLKVKCGVVAADLQRNVGDFIIEHHSVLNKSV